MKKPGLTQAKEWLRLTRKAAKDGNFAYIEYFYVASHAYYCPCRELSEARIINPKQQNTLL
jgi:hypothetical protein